MSEEIAQPPKGPVVPYSVINSSLDASQHVLKKIVRRAVGKIYNNQIDQNLNNYSVAKVLNSTLQISEIANIRRDVIGDCDVPEHRTEPVYIYIYINIHRYPLDMIRTQLES